MILNNLQVQYPDFFDAVHELDSSGYISFSPAGKEFIQYRITRVTFGITKMINITRNSDDNGYKLIKIDKNLADTLENYLSAELGVTRLTYKFVKEANL